MRTIRVGLGIAVFTCSCLLLAAQTNPRETAAPENIKTAATTLVRRATQRDIRRVQKYVPGQLLVRFRPGIGKHGAQEAHARLGVQVLREFRVVPDLQVVQLPPAMTVAEARRYYRARPEVLYAEPNYYRWADQSPVAPNDPHFSEMWNLHNTGQTGGTAGADIHAPEAWGLSTGSSSVVIGVIDTGVDYTHPDLAANMYRNQADCNSNGLDDDGDGYVDDCYGINAITGNGNVMDDAGHGTHVAGTIGAAGNNALGVVGVNWQVGIIGCKFLSSDGGGTDADAIECLQYLAKMKDRGVNLVATNNSWGGGAFSQALIDAIDAHRQRGMLFIAAAGNSRNENDLVPSYPAGYDLPNIISVAATDHNDALAEFSSFGRRTVHVAAPGVSILSTVPGALYGDQYLTASGTSMATPHVTGVAALLKAQDATRDWRAIKNLIMAGGDAVPGAARTISQRRLNAYGSMTCADTVVQLRLQPAENDVYALPGDTVTMRYLNIRCGAPNGALQATVDGGPETIVLRDDGVAPDQQAGDGVYVAQRQWLSSEIGDHTLTFANQDVVTVHVLSGLAPYVFSTDVAFNYREIVDGTDLQLRDDDSATIRPPFPVQFGGASFPTLSVNSNGNITFFGPFVQWENSPLPTPETRAMIAPYWDDTYGIVQWGVLGTAPTRELAIEWRDEMSMGCVWSDYQPFHGRFQVVFFEGSSDILFNYADVTLSRLHDPSDDWWGCMWDANAGVSATIGVQSTSSLANQFSFNTARVTNNSSILWQAGELTPSISQLSPFAVQTGASAFTLHAMGQSFLQDSVIRWNGSDRPTTFVNAGELTTAISAADVATAGTARVTVFNLPPHGSGESAAVLFHIHDQWPVPALTTVAPDEVKFGRIANLTLTGSGFVPGSVARWNAANLTTVAISDTQLRATVPSDMLSMGTAQITVFNPAPGGGTSNAVPVNIVNPVPTIYLAPRFVGAGGEPFTLYLLGYDMTPGSVVRWRGSDRATNVTANRHGINAAVLATDVQSASTAEVTIFNPPPGGGNSEPATITLLTPPANDKVTNATVIPTFPFALTENPLGATADPLDPQGSCNPYGTSFETLWFVFTPPGAGGFVRADTIGSNYDNFVSAYSGGPGNWTSLGCAAGWADQAVGFPVTSTAPIYFMVFTQFPNWFNNDSLVLHVDVGSGFKTELNPASNSVTRGSPATFTLTLTPVFGSYDTPIALQCWAMGQNGALPCSLSQSKVTLGGSPATVTLTVSTATTTAAAGTRGNLFPWWALLSLSGVVLITGNRRNRTVAKLGMCLIVVALLGLHSGCGTGNRGDSRNPVPSISSLTPSSAVPGGAAFTMDVRGTNFISGSVVRWNGADRSTTYLDGGHLQAAITAADVTSAGTASVTVFNPTPGGGTSNPQTFSIRSTGQATYTIGVTASSGTLIQDARATLVVNF